MCNLLLKCEKCAYTLFTLDTTKYIRRHIMADTRLATRQIRIKEWSMIFKDRIESGMRVDDFCKSRGISRDAYYYWLRKVKDGAIEASGVKFVELKEPKQLPASTKPESVEKNFIPQASIAIGKMNISVNSNTPKELIKNLIEVAAKVK